MHHTPSDTLREEHHAIEHLLGAMEGMAATLESGGRVPRADVDAALDAIVGFADECHHAKEEKVLFGALRDHGQVEALRVVRDLEGDHEASRKLVGKLRGEADAGERGGREEKTRLARDARLYTKLLRTHIDQETTRLFPLLEVLPPARREWVAAEFERVEREETGSGAHERFESAIHALHHKWAPAG